MTGWPATGVDGCKSGWIAVFWSGPGQARAAVYPDFAALFTAAHGPVAVDMPIGLPERLGPGGRGPERAVRPLLGGRQSSVFSVPPRGAVYAPDYRAACEASLAASDPPRKVSKQCFFLFGKMRELDQLLREDQPARQRIFECHPEVAFWRLNGQRALSEPKKVKGRIHAPGMVERRTLLLAAGLPASLVEAKPPKGAGADDLLDACACAVIARRIALGIARPFPNPPGRDEAGLPIAIWA